jgi:DNA repair protein RAD50
MSCIDKLSILGIRSFDNARAETMHFTPPLTLIVGTNGSGKTTIIECLKYATTGETPPNSKTGGAFIHDPNLAQDKEVMAQVRLSFRSTDGHKMVCTRSLQLTVKKTTRSVKALDSSINMFRNGEKRSMSSRVAEINDVMPKYLGTSKAILDSVIFCHQDESLWPLAAPKDLKERFDKIFEAQKYSLAIDNIKVMRKGQNEKLIGFKKDYEHSKLDKDKAERSEKRSMALTDDIERDREQSEELGRQMREMTVKADEAWGRVEQAAQIVGELTGKRIEERTKEESVQSLRLNLTEMSESDDELMRMIQDYEGRVNTYHEEVQTSKERYGALNQEINSMRNQVVSKERESGSYEAQHQSYERQLENRETLIKETARSHTIRGFDLEINDEQARAFMDRIAKMARDQNTAFERARRETSEELQKAQKAITQLNEQKSALSSRKESAKQSIATNDRKIGSLQNQLNQISIDEGGKAAMESSLKDTENRLGSSKATFENSNWDDQIGKADAQLRNLDDWKEKFDAELVQGTRQAGDSARLDFVQKELKDRQQSLNTMSGAHGDRIASIVGPGWEPSTIETAFQRALEEKHIRVTEAEKQRDGTGRELEQLDFKLNSLRSDLKSKRASVQAAVKAIVAAVDCEPKDYSDELSEIERSYSISKSDADSAKLIRRYFQECLVVAKDHKACNTCKRGFKTDKERDNMRAAVEKQLSHVEEVDSKQLEELEEQLKAARAVGPEFDTWEKLTNKDIPMAEAEETKLTDKREKLNAQLEQQDGEVDERRAAKRDIEAMSRTVQNIVKYSNEISSFEGQIAELLAKQKLTGGSRGLEAVQDDIKRVNEESRSTKTHLAKLTHEKDRTKTLINSLELEVRDIRSKLSTADYQLKEKLSLEGQIEELKGGSTGQREAIRHIDQDIQGLGPQLSQAQAKYDDISSRGADKDRELQADISKLNNSLNQLKMASQEIHSYIERGGESQLKRVQREIESLKSEVARLEKEQNTIAREVKRNEDALRNVDDTKRQISDNQRYRRDLRALKTVRAQIQELERTNAEADKARNEREGAHYHTERQKLASAQATIVGEMKSKDNQLQQLLDDYEIEYKDAAKQYKLAHIQVETTKACIEDLGRYIRALDNAIMKYHTLKMEEINRIVDELWRKTYQGTDIDTILIKSENENAKANKSYNYRVCMIKSDAEMDMRGRCSAGQRVLASIIIRLALAECFGVNCGLIALDEPTTNLDSDNIRALAMSLSEIIRVRRQQKNFQLIVITHDEDFLRAMQCGDFADNYWRVSRNDKQKSQIERQSIAEVL